MSKEKKLQKLKNMMGKTWLTRMQEQYVFHTFQIDGDRITIATDREWLETTFYDLQVFTDDLIEIETAEIIPEHKTTLPEKSRHTSNVLPPDQMTALRDTLLSTIRKVQEDPNSIKQAKSVTNTVNALVGLAKLEIQLKRSEE